MEKLIVVEFEVTEDSVDLPLGAKYSYFQDPETGKWYRPRATFEVTGKNLETLFAEVE